MFTGQSAPLTQQTDAIGIGHPDIEQDQIGQRARARDSGLSGIGGHVDLIALIAEDIAHQCADVRFVIDDQDVAGTHAFALWVFESMARTPAGNTMRTLAPPSGRLPTSM